MRRTQFRCIRNFWFAGRGDCRVGDLLELNDDQARELVALGDTVEPTTRRDRCRVLIEPRVTWAPTKPEIVERPRIVGSIASAKRRPLIAA